jgi:hypothetical protein
VCVRVHIHTYKVVRRSLIPHALHVASRLVCIWEESLELVLTCGVICTESHHANMMWALTDTVDIYFFYYCAAKHRHRSHEHIYIGK